MKNEAGVYAARGVHELHLQVTALAQDGFRIVAVIDTRNGDYQVVAQRDGTVEPHQPTSDSTATSASWLDLLDAAVLEAEKAMQRYPQPNYTITKVAEEAGEVVKAAVHAAEGREEPQAVRDEIKQLVAMLYRLWVEGDQVHGLKPLKVERGDG